MSRKLILEQTTYFQIMRSVLFLILMSASLTGCNDQPADGRISETFDIQGHRGCRGLMPENSIPGFINAVNLGVTTLEMDVVITADKQVVVSHEPFFSAAICKDSTGERIDPETAEERNIYEMTYEEVKSYDCGSLAHPDFPQQKSMKVHKPLLSDVIKAVESFLETKQLGPVHYNIEAKSRDTYDELYHPKPEEFTKLLLEVIDREGIADRSIIQSFDPRILNEVNDQNPDLRTAILISNQLGFEHNLQRLDFTPTIYSPHQAWLTESMITYMHEREIQVIPWTVNETEKMKTMIEMGVDGIITDYPNRLIDLVAQK